MKNYPETSIESLFRDKFGDRVSGHKPLKDVLPVGIGGVCRYYLEAQSIAEIIEAARIAIENKIPYRVIGDGTATLVGESGYSGLMIKPISQRTLVIEEHSRVICDCSLGNSMLVATMASRGLGGLEFIAAIPGSIGGAVITGAEFGTRKIKSYVKEISFFDPDTKEIAYMEGQNNDSENISNYFLAEGLVFPPILLTVTLQFARLTQEEILRRLRLIGPSNIASKKRCLGHVFSLKLSGAQIDKDTQKQLRQLNIDYDNRRDLIVLRNNASPSQVRGAVNLLKKVALAFGIEESERITYLGYYQEDDAT